MMTASTTTPKNIAITTNFNFMFNKLAIKDPDQTPVPGIGMAINKNKPIPPYFKILSLFALALLSQKSDIFLKRVPLRYFKNFFTNINIKGAGARLPITQMIKAYHQSTPRKLAAIIPPLNSKTGNIDIKKITNSGGAMLFRYPVSEVTR